MLSYKTKSGELRYKEKVRINGNELTRTFNRKIDAIEWKRKQEVQKADKKVGRVVCDSIPFSRLADAWFETNVSHVRATKTASTYKSVLENVVKPFFKDKLTGSIQSRDVELFRETQARKGLSAKTVNRFLTVLRQVIRFGVRRENFLHNPIKEGFLLPQKQSGKFHYFSELEVQDLLRRGRDHSIYPLVWLGLHTGMRPGELMGLCWDRVNFVSRTIEVTRTLLTCNRLQDQTKGKKDRYIPINDQVYAFLLAHRKAQDNPRFVFTNSSGRPFNPTQVKKREFEKMCDQCGVRKLRLHDLRHTFASHFMMKNGNVVELKELLGHSDLKHTMIYAHLSPEHLRKAAGIVNFGVDPIVNESSGSRLGLVRG